MPGSDPARLLAEFTAEFETALDRRASMTELRHLDAERARAEHAVSAAPPDPGSPARDQPDGLDDQVHVEVMDAQ